MLYSQVIIIRINDLEIITVNILEIKLDGSKYADSDPRN